MVSLLHDKVLTSRGPELPIVVVGNKSDLERNLDIAETESIVQCDWEQGYVECSAKDNENVQDIFKELLMQVRSQGEVLPAKSNSSSTTCSPPLNMRRRQSLPIVPVFGELGVQESFAKRNGRRRSSLAVVMGRDSCKIS